MGGGVGFYVHHHGRGHANRTRQIARHLSLPVTIFSSDTSFLEDLSSERIRIVPLPSDVVPIHEGNRDWPDVLHYAPLQVPGIRVRMHRMAEWIVRESPALLVVDVSVEVALLARLFSLPTIIVRQHGLRNDAAHTAAFQSCSAMLAPYAAYLEDPSVPQWVRQKTYYAGGFSRFSQRTLPKDTARQQLTFADTCRHVVVVSGLGGPGTMLQQVIKAAETTSGWMWWVLGPVSDEATAPHPRVRLVGEVADPYPFLIAADVVVGSAGNNTVMEVATAGARFVCIPEARPFEEQHSKAAALQRLGAATVLQAWPEAKQWPRLLVDTAQQDVKIWQQLANPHGAEEAADFIRQTVARLAKK